MRVLLLAHSLRHGGAQRQIVELARGLSARGHETVVSAFYAGGAFEDELRESAVTVRGLDKRGRWELGPFLLRAARLLRAERPDVVYAFLIAPNLLATLLRPVRPETRVVWGVRASDMDLTRYDRLARWTFRAGCVLSRLPDRILVNSHAGLAYHEAQGYPADRMRVVPNGIDTERFRPDPSAGRRARADLGLAVDSREKLVGVVARLDPMKDHRTLLEAVARLPRDAPRARFVCVGDGPAPYRSTLAALARELGCDDRVVWAGERRDMPSVYNAFDLLVSASAFGEGFSNAIGEAMACGVPCVVTDVGDSARIVGRSGRVVPPGRPALLAEAMRAALADPAGAGRGDALRERIVREYSVERMIERTERELLELVA